MDTVSISHLTPKAAAQLELSSRERIRIIRAGSFITLERTEAVLDALEDMLHAPRVTRPKNLLLVGDPNNGKSTILEHFLETSNGPTDPSAQKAAVKVVMINAPPAGDRKDFYIRILEALFVVYNPTASYSALRPQAVRLFREHGIEVLIIDELHDALSGTERQQNLFNAELKQFSNETKARIAAAGLEKAGTLFIRDTQMTSRFTRMFLKPFAADKELGTLLATMEKRLPLRQRSNLKDPRIVAEVAHRSEGAIGDVCDLIAHCAVAVIKSGATPECITLKTIQNIDWQRPTARKAFTRLGRDKAAAAERDADAAFSLNFDDEDRGGNDRPGNADDNTTGAASGAAPADQAPPSVPTKSHNPVAKSTPVRKGPSAAAKAAHVSSQGARPTSGKATTAAPKRATKSPSRGKATD